MYNFKIVCISILFIATPEIIKDRETLNVTLKRWVNSERFGFFPKISRSNINDLMDTKKYIVIAVVSENKLNEITQTERDFKDMVESIIRYGFILKYLGNHIDQNSHEPSNVN